MTLSTQLKSALTRLIGFSSPMPHTSTLTASRGVEVEIDFMIVESLSCSVSELRISVPDFVDAEFDVLRKWAEALCGKVTYLLENIGPLEFSPDSGQVLIRSNPPDQQTSATKFYEVILQSHSSGNFSLRRFESVKGRPGRKPVDITSTHELLHKLVNDLVDSIPKAN
ncbi:MAG: hypothetical protein IID45_10575 [Planctomycetes bacterium]|nr:hypothetical protein [Planctomycetota bacterium]